MKHLISSKQNPKFKAWRKLHTRKGRKQAQAYLIEGEHILAEAIQAGVEIVEIIVAEDYQGGIKVEDLAYPSTYIDKILVESLAQTETPQGIFAHVSMKPVKNWWWQGKRYLLVDGIQDPGNLGTMIRTAAAANYDGVVLGQTSVDLYNDKLIRSSQGSIWHLPILQMDLPQAIANLQKHGVQIIASALNPQALGYSNLNPDSAYGFVLGNEGQGISETVIKLADQVIYIPMYGPVESLNVAVAAGIIMFAYPNP